MLMNSLVAIRIDDGLLEVTITDPFFGVQIYEKERETANWIIDNWEAYSRRDVARMTMDAFIEVPGAYKYIAVKDVGFEWNKEWHHNGFVTNADWARMRFLGLEYKESEFDAQLDQ